MDDRSMAGAPARRRRALPLVGLAMAGLLAAGALQPTSAGYTDRVHATSASTASEVVPAFQVGLSKQSRTVETGLALSASGQVLVWGTTAYGLSGGAPGGFWMSPTVVPGLPPIRQLTAGILNVNALDESGQVWGWGLYPERDGTNAPKPGDAPQRVRIETAWNSSGAVLDRLVAVSSTEYAGAGIRADGTVWYWGTPTGYGGNSGVGASQLLGLPDPTLPGNRPVYLKGAYTNFFLVLENGEVYSWGGTGGDSLPGNLGNSGSTPVRITALSPWARHNVAPGGAYIVAVDGGINMGAAILSNGQVLSWGSNSGRIGGRGTASAPASSPALVPGLSDIQSMQFGFTGALFQDGASDLYGYGASDDYGQLPTTPVLVDEDVAQYSSGQGFYLWQTDDGSFWGRGYNPTGAIGMPPGVQTSNRTISWDLSVIGAAE